MDDELTQQEKKCVRFLAARYRAGQDPVSINETSRIVAEAIGGSSRTAALILRKLLDAGYLRVVATLSGEFTLVVLESILAAEERAQRGLLTRVMRLFRRG